MRKFDVIIFGSVTVDVFLTSKVFGGGERSKFLQLPWGRKIEVDKEMVGGGGGGGNTAVGLQRLGLKTAVTARLGKDRFRGLICEELKREGVERGLLSIRPREEIDYSVILVGGQGNRTILVARGESCLEEEDVIWDKLAAGRFHISSLEGNLGLVRKLLEFAGRRGIKVSWNPGRRELEQKEKVFSLLKGVEILVLNQREMEYLLGWEAGCRDFWREMWKIPTRMVLLTRGDKGAWLIFPQNKNWEEIGSFSVRQVETTGAGDAFCSGLVAALEYGKEPREAVLWGLANGASVVEHFGAKQGLLTKEGMQKWLERK